MSLRCGTDVAEAAINLQSWSTTGLRTARHPGQSGSDVAILYGANATVALQNNTVAEIVTSQQGFLFDPTGSDFGLLV